MYFLLCQDWRNTSGNHAGIKYLCSELERRYPDSYVKCCIPDLYFSNTRIKFVRYLNLLSRFVIYLYILFWGLKIICCSKKGDVLFLMEYLEKLSPQYIILPIIRLIRKDIKVFGMVHLVPKRLENSFDKDFIRKKLNALDLIATLGNSLTEFFIKEYEIPSRKVITMFHYVDNLYYENHNGSSKRHQSFKVIAMGNQMRNYEILNKIIFSLPNVDFLIFKGFDSRTEKFSSYPNVKVLPFLPESSLKEMMEESDVSLNCMEDTIGSNVIVTSLAMGLAMVCSDVGSIHDYCDQTNCFFCNDENDFIDAIKKLSLDQELLSKMKRMSRQKSHKLSIVEFHKKMQCLLLQ